MLLVKLVQTKDSRVAPKVLKPLSLKDKEVLVVNKVPKVETLEVAKLDSRDKDSPNSRHSLLELLSN
jgi:hypothetical protein